MTDIFFEKTIEALNKIKDTQGENISQAARFIADTIKNDGLIRPFGTGHSHLVATEIYMRAGGLVPVAPLLEGNLMMHEGGRKSSSLERLTGYAAVLLSLYDVSKNDTLIVISQSGRNSVPVEMAMEGKKRGMKTIAITSLAHSQSVLSRHPSGKRLFEVADLTLDTCTPIGDASVLIEEIDTAIAPLSTICGVFIWHTISIEASKILLSEGVKPPVFMSANAPGGDEHNIELFQKYRNRVPF
jgi:uncharacterized phosphosugar-binding protein